MPLRGTTGGSSICFVKPMVAQDDYSCQSFSTTMCDNVFIIHTILHNTILIYQMRVEYISSEYIQASITERFLFRIRSI